MTAFDTDPADLQSPQSVEKSRSTSLSSAHISKALQDSSDSGVTLIFSRLKLSDIGPWAAEELGSTGKGTLQDQGCVKRVALDHNRLTTLPMEFALLSRLRYLNLKYNNFSVFPDVLTLIPSLDTLDIGYNKIKRLPSEAGELVNLRVFCLSRNQLVRLPPYLAKFGNLEVLQVERNPIEWPPKHVIEPTGGLDSSHAMQAWIRTLQRWIDLESREKNNNSVHDEERNLANPIDDGYSSWKFPLREHASPPPHTRSFSVDSNFSVSSITTSLQDSRMISPESQDQRPPLHLGILGTASAQPSPTRSFESYLPSPANLESFRDNDDVHLHQLQHLRTNSYDASERLPVSSSKKSMSDLTVAELNSTLEKISKLPTDHQVTITCCNRTTDGVFIPTSLREGSGLVADSRDQVCSPATKELDGLLPIRAMHSVTLERDSYFRRLSMLPAPKTLPKALVCLINSIRNILFAICEIYQSLLQYLIHITDDKISSVLRKILDSASADIVQLINFLDRFDAISQKMFPAPAICRGVVESCKDAVAAFSKALGVLGLHLKVTTDDDARYSRWILLDLYAGAAEVSCAWQSMVHQIDLIKPLLRAKTFSSSPLVLSTVGSEAYPPIAVFGLLDPTPWPRSTGPGVSAAATVGKVRTARRHAGSFSSKDVEIGRNLPSYEDFPGTFAGIAPGGAPPVPILRAPQRQMTIPLTTIQSPSPTMPTSQPSAPRTKTYHHHDLLSSAHSRQGSQASLLTSASYSPSLPSRTIFSELPANSKNQVDKEALQAIYAAVEIAPVVCDMIEDVLGDILTIKMSVRDTIRHARIATMRLSDTVRTSENTHTALSAKTLREDAHTFLKNVVQLSGVVKTYAGLHTASSTLRNNMVKLTSSTEEFAILLHVSSFVTPRPHPPVLSVSIDQANSIGLDEKHLGTRLSRSRSAHGSPTFKLQSQADGARSALPVQMFQVPHMRRLRSRDQYINIADPG